MLWLGSHAQEKLCQRATRRYCFRLLFTACYICHVNRAELEAIGNQWSLALAVLMVGRYRQHSRQCTSSGWPFVPVVVLGTDGTQGNAVCRGGVFVSTVELRRARTVVQKRTWLLQVYMIPGV